MTAHCPQCGQYKAIKEAKTAELRAEVTDWYNRQCVEAVEQELSAEFILDEALNIPGFDRHMGSV